MRLGDAFRCCPPAACLLFARRLLFTDVRRFPAFLLFAARFLPLCMLVLLALISFL